MKRTSASSVEDRGSSISRDRSVMTATSSIPADNQSRNAARRPYIYLHIPVSIEIPRTKYTTASAGVLNLNDRGCIRVDPRERDSSHVSVKDRFLTQKEHHLLRFRTFPCALSPLPRFLFPPTLDFLTRRNPSGITIHPSLSSLYLSHLPTTIF